MKLNSLVVTGAFCSTIAVLIDARLLAEDPSNPSAVTPALLQSVEERYASEVAKADAVLAKAEAEVAKQKKLAAEIRLKAYKEKLSEITKTGDFDKAIKIKARIVELEKAPDGSISSKDSSKTKPGVRIISALYGVNQSWIDVTTKVERLISSPSPIVSDLVFGDPAPDYQPGNTLIVRYEKQGIVKVSAIYTGGTITLP